MAVKIDLDLNGINQLLNSPGSELVQEVSRTTERIRSAARNNVNSDTGAMRAGIRSSINIVPFVRITGLVESTDPASMFVERGTDGATKSSGVFRFPDRGGSQRNSNNRGPWVYTKSFKGQPAQEFMWRALKSGTRSGSIRWRVNRDS